MTWCSQERLEKIGDVYESPIAPEICIDVLSTTNTEEEMQEKRALYFSAGAKEFWLVSMEGKISFYLSHQQSEQSHLVPSMVAELQ